MIVDIVQVREKGGEICKNTCNNSDAEGLKSGSLSPQINA